MLRCLSLCAVLLVLASPPTAEAQTSKPRSFADRFKSLFTREEKPKAPAARPVKPALPSPQKPPAKPMQVTTRSGALRQTGPENPVPLQAEPTPTFAPEEIPLAGKPPRKLDVSAARKLPIAPPPPKKPLTRDPAVRQAAYESQAEKPTMASWFRGLWTRKKKTQPTAPQPHLAPGMAPAETSGTSIDPRRVYRAPQSPASEQNRAGSGRISDFSESGVPRSTSEFRGRRDSSF